MKLQSTCNLNVIMLIYNKLLPSSLFAYTYIDTQKSDITDTVKTFKTEFNP